METTASSFKLRANVPEGRKRFPINSPLAARSDARASGTPRPGTTAIATKGISKRVIANRIIRTG